MGQRAWGREHGAESMGQRAWGKEHGAWGRWAWGRGSEVKFEIYNLEHVKLKL